MLFSSVALKEFPDSCLLIAMVYLNMHYGMNIFERNHQSVVSQSVLCIFTGQSYPTKSVYHGQDFNTVLW